MTSTTTDADAATLALLATRAPDATICPSEVARLLGRAARTDDAEDAEEDWRVMMPAVHAAVDRLVDEAQVRLSWKGRALASRTGPYRIGRGPRG